jgi:hypothetical protein
LCDRATIRWRYRFGEGDENSVRGVKLMRVRDGKIVGRNRGISNPDGCKNGCKVRSGDANRKTKGPLLRAVGGARLAPAFLGVRHGGNEEREGSDRQTGADEVEASPD